MAIQPDDFKKQNMNCPDALPECERKMAISGFALEIHRYKAHYRHHLNSLQGANP
jgi:hypothetical protein